MLDIKLKSLTYPNGYTALKNVELQFPDTGMYMIVGESGSGKSTLMQCLSGMLEFDGDLTYDDKVLKGQELENYRRNEVGYIFQDYKMFDNLSAIDNVILGSQIVGQYTDKESAYNYLKDVGLEKIYNKKTKLLSGGEKQRVAIARAIAKKSNIIVADEPTGNLDSKNSRMIMSLLKDISKSRLVLVVTHNMELAQKFGDKIIKLSDGRVVEVLDNTIADEITTIKSYKEDFKPTAKANRMSVKSLFQLAFLRRSGTKLIATTLLALVVCIIAVFSTMIAGQNKVNLTERYLSKQDGFFAKTSFIYNNGQQAFITQQDYENYSLYVQCEGWHIDLPQTSEDHDSNQSNNDIGQIDYCLQLGEQPAGVELLYGSYPEKVGEVCIPISIARTLALDITENVVGQTIRINTGFLYKEFVVKGIFESYESDISDYFLNRCVIISSIGDLLQVSTAEKYVDNSFICKKGGIDIVLYNAKALGQDVAKGEVLLSPSLRALASMISSSEVAKGVFSFVFSDKSEYVKKTIAGIEVSLNLYAVVLNGDDYNDLIDTVDIKYAGITFNSSILKVTDAYKIFESNNKECRCYISGNYMPQEFIDTVTTIEAINIKIMLPIAIVFWILSVMCMYIMLKNLLMANKKNLSIMRVLGIKRSQYYIVNCMGNVIHLIIVAVLAVVIVACLNAILSSGNFLLSLIMAFTGWEFLGLVLSMIVAIAFSLFYLHNIFMNKL